MKLCIKQIVIFALTKLQEKVKDTKDRILEEAFRLFMTKGYEGTSIKDIEIAIEKTRGAIFYFFKTKQEVFQEVVDKYILNMQFVHSKLDFEENMSLKEFIYLYIDGINRTMSKMLSLSIVNIYKSYFTLYLEAARHYPNFSEIATQISMEEIHVWEVIIRGAIKAKEISVIDVHAYALLFRSAFLGLSFERCLLYGLNPEELLNIYMSIYETIRLK